MFSNSAKEAPDSTGNSILSRKDIHLHNRTKLVRQYALFPFALNRLSL